MVELIEDKIKVYIMEDNELTRNVVKSLIEQVSDFEIVGEAEDGEQAVINIGFTEPDIIIADIGLPGIDGISAVRRIREEHPGIRAIMLTAHDSDDDLFQSFKAGAEGYILKTGLTKRRLELAIKSVEDGSVWLDPLIADRVLKAAASGVMPSHAVAPLSGEERNVLEHVAAAAQTPQCENGVCHVDPSFIANLRRFSRQENKPEQAVC